MTIRKRLFVSFLLILIIVTFIIGIFFYTIYNLNSINSQQNNRYEQIIRIKKLKEFNNSYSWIVLDIITDFDKIEVVNKRIKKVDTLFKELIQQKEETINNFEKEEKSNLILIFKNFEIMQKMIKKELYNLVLLQNNDFTIFNKKFTQINTSTYELLNLKINYLQNKLNETKNKRNDFLDTIKIELVILFILLLLLSFIISSKIINEIKDKLDKLNQGVLQLFRNDYKIIEVDIGKNNELREITQNLNSYLEKQSNIIQSREELLRNISHELKTPIAKGKFIIQKLKSENNTNNDQIVKNINTVFYDIEKLTNKLLEREKLNFAILKRKKFKVSSLILESLSKLLIEDETKVIVKIENDFNIEADFYYLTIALKNLIDNAMKYTKKFPITIKSKNNIIYIENTANKLSNDLIYYIQPFTRETNQQQGHGLGLNIVNKILELHDFNLEYEYKNSKNIFKILIKNK